jgi:hypothetical protein
MHDVGGGPAFGVLALACVGDGDRGAVGQQQFARVARLPAAKRVEHAAVEHDAVFVDGDDGGAALGEVGVLAKEVLGHAFILRGEGHKP